MKKFLWLLLFVVVLSGCSSKPSDNDIKRQIFGENDSEFFSYDKFEKLDGILKNDKLYIADVQYNVTFKVGFAEAREKVGILGMLPLTYLFGTFEKGSTYVLKRKITLIKKESGWTMEDLADPSSVQRIVTKEEEKAIALKKKQEEEAAAAKKVEEEKKIAQAAEAQRAAQEKIQAEAKRRLAEGKILEDDTQKLFAAFKREFSGNSARIPDSLGESNMKVSMTITQFSENQLTANLNLEITYPKKNEPPFTLTLHDIVVSNLKMENRPIDKAPAGRNVSWYFKGQYTPHEEFEGAPLNLMFDLFHSNEGPVVEIRIPARILRSKLFVTPNAQFVQKMVPTAR